MSKTFVPTSGNQPVMPSGLAPTTQFEAAQLYDLFDSLSDIASENVDSLLTQFSLAINGKSISGAIYVQSHLARLHCCLAPHLRLMQELAAHYQTVSITANEKEVLPC